LFVRRMLRGRPIPQNSGGNLTSMAAQLVDKRQERVMGGVSGCKNSAD